MSEYKLNDAELYFKEQLEKKGYKFIEKDGEKPIIIAEPFSKDDIELFGITPENTQKIVDKVKKHSCAFFVDTNGMVLTNWLGY